MCGECIRSGDVNTQQKEAGTRGGQRGQGNFELAANSDYNSRGSADPRESLRKRRISKLALTAHKVLFTQGIPVQPLFVSRELFVGGNQWGRRVVAFFSGACRWGRSFMVLLERV